MCLRVSNKKKYEKNNFFASLKSLKKVVGSRAGSGSGPKYKDDFICYSYSQLPLKTSRKMFGEPYSDKKMYQNIWEKDTNSALSLCLK
jgi:hypothetical protein